MKAERFVSLTAMICVISVLLLNSTGAVSGSGGAVNFSAHIAPIIFNHCTSCHRPGEAAPFTLLNYNEVKKRGRLIADLTHSRVMPPWKADEGSYEFKNERRLTAAQIELIQRWVADGMPEGDPLKLPAIPKFTEGWQLGQPDLVVRMSEAYSVPAGGPDIYRNFVIPLGLTEDKWVRAVDFRPGARTVVHHSLFFLDTTGTARKLDAEDPQPGYNGGMGGGVINLRALLSGGNQNKDGGAARSGSPLGNLGGWALGAQARVLPDGLAFFVPKGADLILSTHFHPSGKPEQELSTVGLYFADQPPTKAFTGIQLPPLFGVFKGLDIPAGAREYTIEDSFVLPVDVKAFGVGAHAHYLGKQMKLTATLPDGQTKTLLWIRDWDFAWQDQYRFKEFVTLPKGTRLDVKVSYDNTADNPRNPSNPPRRVHWGEGSTDEMGSMSLMVVAANESEMPLLRQTFVQHIRDAFTNRRGLPDLQRAERQPGR